MSRLFGAKFKTWNRISFFSGRHDSRHAVRADVLHQAAQVVAAEVQEDHLHAEEIRLKMKFAQF